MCRGGRLGALTGVVRVWTAINAIGQDQHYLTLLISHIYNGLWNCNDGAASAESFHRGSHSAARVDRVVALRLE